MRRDEIYLPPDFESVEGKLKVVDDSIDQLLDATDRMANTGDDEDTADAIVELLADMTASLVVLHMVIADMLQNETKGLR